MLVLTSHSDTVGIRKLTDGELVQVAGGETAGDEHSCISELKNDISTFFASVDAAISDVTKKLLG